MGHKDLRFGQIVYILVFYKISISILASCTGRFPIYFFLPCLFRDSENEELALQRYLKRSANNSATETVGNKDLRLGKIVYILVFYNISFSWLLPLNDFQFIFLGRVYCVTYCVY